jgi:hypothetical protein
VLAPLACARPPGPFSSPRSLRYGDISPVSTGGRAAATIYLLVAVVSIGNVLSTIAGAFVEAKRRETLEKILSKKITRDDFEKCVAPPPKRAQCRARAAL